MTDQRILCFGSAATAAEFFAFEKKMEKKKGTVKHEEEVEREHDDQEQMKRKRERDDEGPERKRQCKAPAKRSVFERLGVKNQSKQKTHKPHRQNKRSKGEVKFPEWNNYALMGDSIMVRLGKAMKVTLPNSSACRGGLTTTTLADILRKLDSTPKKVIMLIGVNDVMTGTSKDAIVQNLHYIMTMLRLKGTEKVIVMELLPILNLRSPQLAKKILEINESISQMKGGIVEVLPIHNCFMKKTRRSNEPNRNLFERKKSANIMELHPGAAGNQLIANKLKSLLDGEDDLIVL